MSIYDDHAKRFLKNCGIRITGKYKGRYVPLWDKEPHSTWEIVLHRESPQKGERQAIFITFYQSHADKYKTPTAYDVLANLIKGDVGTFDDFCIMFGYDKYDETGKINQTAKRVYNCYVKEYKRVLAFFTRPDEMYRLYDIY